jgi:hypothetical protein
MECVYRASARAHLSRLDNRAINNSELLFRSSDIHFRIPSSRELQLLSVVRSLLYPG